MSWASKDSSGDWDNTANLLRAFPGFAIFPSSESMMTRASALGGAGCISATLNVNPRGVRDLHDALARRAPEAVDLQARASDIRALVTRFPLVPAVKAIVARRLSCEAIATVRPPLEPLPEDKRLKLFDAFSRLDTAAG